MTAYALLIRPSVNRVYTGVAGDLALAELEVFNRSVLGGRLTDLDRATMAGVSYITFTGHSLTQRDIAYLSNASAAYALFESRVAGPGADDLLAPVALNPLARFDDDLVTILKYPGKTNEQLTKLLLNVTLLSSAAAPELLNRRLRILDPLCGRGTTLNQALTYGYDAAGLDLDGKDFDAYSGFIQTYLKRKKIKHKAQAGPVRRERRVVARRLTVTVGASKAPGSAKARDSSLGPNPHSSDPHLDSDPPLTLDVVHADTLSALEFFRRDSFDAIVTDAPYGVQHGSRTVAKGLRRSPLELLTQAAPVWSALLRPGAAMGIAFNTLVVRRAEVAEVLAAAGLEVLDGGPYAAFRHRVDQAILRDILVARKPSESPVSTLHSGHTAGDRPDP